MVARVVWDDEAAGSSPVSPTNQDIFIFYYQSFADIKTAPRRAAKIEIISNKMPKILETID